MELNHFAPLSENTRPVCDLAFEERGGRDEIIFATTKGTIGVKSEVYEKSKPKGIHHFTSFCQLFMGITDIRLTFNFLTARLPMK
jgi:hypothetical protein